MYSGCNSYVEKLELLPDHIELLVNKSWCYSVISIMERVELCEDLICIVNTCIYNGEYGNDSYRNIDNKYVKISVGIIKRIINICGKETLYYILPDNYERLSNDFLCSELGDLKPQIDNLIDLEKYDQAFDLISNMGNIFLKRLALIYMKYIYTNQTEKKITFFKKSRKPFINKIDSIIKKISDN